MSPNKSRPTRVPKARPPLLLESDYAAQLVAMVHEWRSAAAGITHGLFVRTDSGMRAKPRIDHVRNVVHSTVTRTPVVAEKTARRTVRYAEQQVAKQTKAAFGTEVPALVPGLDARVQAFIHENTALVNKLGQGTINDIDTIMARGFSEGLDEEVVADLIVAKLGIAERHARFIARDQMQRLYAQVMQMQYQDLGVDLFRWQTMEDRRVRPSHAVKQGKIFPWEGSRAPSFLPGEEIACRCFAEPFFDEIKASVRDLA